jgi:peptidoglycan/xylan/chitin deacetylase (PgdA/CDA1 family)
MTYSNALYQPSVLELAQEGNCRALTYWINSFLGPQGIYVQVQPAPSRYLRIFVDFQRPKRRESCMHLRERLVRFICYRLWTLNSEVIRGVQIVARLAGDSRVLWQQSVRLKTPIGAGRLHRSPSQIRQRQAFKQLRFRVVRSLFLSSITLVGFLMGYWLFYLEVNQVLGKGKQAEPETAALPPAAPSPSGGQPVGQVPQKPIAPPSTPVPKPRETTFAVPEEFRGQVISQTNPAGTEKVVALTFDDGPRPETTSQVLDILKQRNVKATFFMVGQQIQQFPDLARRVVAEGHAVGNHTLNNIVDKVDEATAAHEIDDMEKLLYETTGAKTSLFRPPNGQLDNGMAAYAQRKKYAVTLWSVDSQDYYVAAPTLLDNVLKHIQSGKIVLMHDGGGDRSATVQALAQLITTLQQQGYKFVTVPELLQMHQAPASSEEAPDKKGTEVQTHTRAVIAEAI